MDTDTWKLEESRYDEEFLARSESLFSVGNGYLGFRGFFCEREPAHHPGVFINGFYELSSIHYGEDAYAFARYNQTMLDVPDCRFVDVFVDGEPFCMDSAGVEEYRRVLDFRAGVLRRSVTWTTAAGRRVALGWETLISFVHTHIGCLRLTVRTDGDAVIQVRSSIVMPASRPVSGLDPRVGTILTRPSLTCIESEFSGGGKEPNGFQASFKTEESGLHLTCGAVHDCAQPARIGRDRMGTPPLPALVFTVEGTAVDLQKCFYYHTSGRSGELIPLQVVRESRKAAAGQSWDSLVASQKDHMERFWQGCDVQVDGDDRLQQALRFNFFQLHQSAGTDGMSGLAAKGLTGMGYEGHCFWDTEIYGMPFFSHTLPGTARALIRYRISLLDHARARARELSQRGALYPWRTINGLEASAYFPAGTAQYHINADIAYSILQYLEVTGDDGILMEGAAELIIETARLWYDLGFFNPARGGAFCINEVTGPDEYSALVDNNCYTNAMARHHLEGACAVVHHLETAHAAYWESLSSSLGMQEEEVASWSRAAEAMRIPFDPVLGINVQDDGFLYRQEWDAAKRGEIRHPMLLNYHPLVIYRHRVIKQADTVLAMLLLHDRFPWYLRKRNFDFYEPLTTGDSSLSACIQGIVAFDCGYAGLGSRYCRETALMDIDDLHRNTKDGLHTAAMAGSWMSMVYGVAGYRMVNGMPVFRPLLPDGWNRLKFRLAFRNVVLEVAVESDHTTYRTEGGSMEIGHRSQKIPVDPVAVMPTKPICRGVVFDLDGVVTSTDRYHYRAWKRLADREGWSFDEQVNERLRGVSRRQSLVEILNYNGVSLEEDRIGQLIDEKNAWYRESLNDLTPADILPGIGALLAELRGNGVRTAVASASRNAPFILERLALTDAFDAVVPASDLVVGKPDPEVFARAAEALGLYPEECAGIEDAPAGVTAVRNAMMRVVGVGSAVRPDSCDLHVASTELLDAASIMF